jgi:hypothetical protein
MNHFDFIKDVQEQKKYIIEGNENFYKPFMVNRGLSYYRETIAYAQMMNMHSDLDPKLQYDFLFHSVRKCKNRPVKWAKEQNPEYLKSVMQYYQYSREKAVKVLEILNKEQLDYIHRIISG